MGSQGSGSVRSRKNELLRQRCRRLLGAGLATPSEAAKLAGISNALMHAWTRDIDWRAARIRAVKKIWQNGFSKTAATKLKKKQPTRAH